MARVELGLMTRMAMAGASLTERSVGVAWFLPLWTSQDKKFGVLSSWDGYSFSVLRKILGACL